MSLLPERMRNLLEKFHCGTATPQEINELKDALDDPYLEAKLRSDLHGQPVEGLFFDEHTSQQILARILEHEDATAHNTAAAVTDADQPPGVDAYPQSTAGTDYQHRSNRRRNFLVAAAILVIGLTGFWWYRYAAPVTGPALNPVTAIPETIRPGKDKAILVLNDGSRIDLDGAADGRLASQGNTAITKNAGQIEYTGAAAATAEAKNTLITPRGGQYQLVLSDGTKVWMNAESSLKYPATFSGSQRVVELQGEAYFEVAKNAAHPFKVMVNGMEVKVLGTHFNINAYSDEATVKTTLLEGSVHLTAGTSEARLSPGQQAQLDPIDKNGERRMPAGSALFTGRLKVIKGVDLEEVVAWKNGYFQFNRASLEAVMRQLQRWYDVEVKYEGRMIAREFGGKISRNSDITDVLKILQASNVHFRIEGKKIIVKNIP